MVNKNHFFPMISIMIPSTYHMGKKGQVFWKSKCVLKHVFIFFWNALPFIEGKFSLHHVHIICPLDTLLFFYWCFMYLCIKFHFHLMLSLTSDLHVHILNLVVRYSLHHFFAYVIRKWPMYDILILFVLKDNIHMYM